TVTVDWGDGTTSPTTIAKTGPGAFSVSASHVYPTVGQRTVKVSLTSRGGATAQGSATIAVAGAPLTPGVVTLRGVEGKACRKMAVGTFRDGNTAAQAADFRVGEIDWGDGAKSAGSLVSYGGGNFGVLGTHTYRNPGRYRTAVRIEDVGGSNATPQGTAI